MAQVEASRAGANSALNASGNMNFNPPPNTMKKPTRFMTNSSCIAESLFRIGCVGIFPLNLSSHVRKNVHDESSDWIADICANFGHKKQRFDRWHGEQRLDRCHEAQRLDR